MVHEPQISVKSEILHESGPTSDVPPAGDFFERDARPDAMSENQQEHFEELLSTHQHRIYAYIFALLRDASDAQDVLQQTAIILWRKFDQYEPNSNFFNWAATVARYEVLNFTKYRRRSRLYFDQVLMDRLADDAQERKSETTEDRRAALRECLEKLRPADRKMVDHRYSHGLGSRQIAEVLGRTPRSVCNSLLRIRKVLLDCIERSLQSDEMP